jgi:SAM-dependent methyltransferase
MFSKNDTTSVVSREEWECYWQDNAAPARFDTEFTPIFHSALQEHLPRRSDLHAIELGCIPGSHLFYLWREFGYTISGVDYCDAVGKTRDNLVAGGASVGVVLKGDVFTVEYPCRFDVVFSAGLAEHFRDPARIVALHAELAKPGGYVVIEVPNLRWLNYLLRAPTDLPCLEQHVQTLMSAGRLAREAARSGLMVLFAGYVGGFSGISIHDQRPDFYHRNMRRLQRATVRALIRHVMWRPRFQRPSALWSPVTLLIARKIGSTI